MVFAIGTAVMVPFSCLALLLWLAKLEETLPNDVRRSRRLPEPESVRAVPDLVRVPAPGAPGLQPAVAEAELSPVPAAS